MIKDILNLNHAYSGGVIDINRVDDEESTSIVIALKNKHTDIAKFLIRYHSDNLDILVKSKKLGNAINLAIKIQDFELID